MRIVRDYRYTPPGDRGAAAAIGNFDGVHIGHQAVIDLARKAGAAIGAPLGVLTFEPHPRQLFQPDAPPFRLMSAETRAHRLRKLGVDVLYELGFTRGMAGLSAREFAQEVLVAGLGLRHVVVGRDVHFGKGRSGNAETLLELGAELGFAVTLADLVHGAAGEVSSTAIRQALTDGRPEDAAGMLGHWHRIDGPVIQGDQRGRDLGFPTVNMSIEGLHPPRFGVYAVLVDVLTGPHAGAYQGAASIGVRPTFGINAPNIETYLFDFSGDLYGADLSVALVAYLRPEAHFASVDALVAQMDDDCARAREILAAHG
jgi:riboflavin kinase/FMN adenylyltransferase